MNGTPALAAELARLIDDPWHARRIAEAAGVAPRSVRWTGTPREFWRDIIAAARRQDRLPQVLDRVGVGAGTGEPAGPVEPVPVDPFAEPDWSALTDEAIEHYERQVAVRSTLLPISFVQRGDAGRPVDLLTLAIIGR